MTALYVRVDVCFFDSPEAHVAGAAAAYLYLRCLAWSKSQLSDGVVPDLVIATWTSEAEALLARLRNVRLLVRAKHFGAPAHRVTAYLKWNLSADQVREARDINAKRQARFRTSKAERDANSNALRDALLTRDRSVTNAVTNALVTRSEIRDQRSEIRETDPDPERAHVATLIPDPEPEPDGNAWLGVAKAYKVRIERATGVAWQSHAANRDTLEALAAWARTQAGQESRPVAAVVERLLDRYFGDEWARSKRYPLRHLGRDPGKYYAAGTADKPLSPDAEKRLREVEAWRKANAIG